MTEVLQNGDQNVEEVTEKIKKFFQDFTGNKNGFDRVLDKLQIVSAGNGKLIAELVVQPEHTNVFGTLHGGCTATIVDVCTSIAMATHSRPGNGVTVNLNISYMNPGKLNDTVVIEANTIKIGRSLGFAEAVITSKTTGAIVAKGSHTKHVENSEKYSLADNELCSGLMKALS